MDNNMIVYRVAEVHNGLAQMVAGGIDFKSADNVILFGAAMNELRAIVQALTKEQEAAEAAEKSND